jgi:hypothetical protein
MSDFRVRDDEPAELPAYLAVLVVDAKEFGNNPDHGQELLARTIPDIVARAFERAGLAGVWRDALFPHSTGDGLGIGFDTRHLPAVVSRFFDALQDVLAERDVRLRQQDRRVRLRMRASLHVGPVRELDSGGRPAAVGSTLITAHRLLDAPAVRDVLIRSDPEETFLSVALSQRVFDDVVARGYAKLPASRLVPRLVRVKEFTGTVYVYVPKPSGELLARGIGDHQQELDTAKAGQMSQHGPTITMTATTSDSGRVYQAGRNQHITEA